VGKGRKMAIVAMMVCTTKTAADAPAANPGTVKMQVVSDPDGEYKNFFKFTPWGSLELGILNEAALDQVEEGATYKVTIEQVPKRT
jgi:hypothetical protein